MAILKMGPIVAAVRGTIAGITFSANASGPYARGWSKGSNPSSALQSDQRGRLGALASAWRDLTQGQRDDWIVYAALPAQDRTNTLGETFSASGFNWFVKINDQLESAGEARRDLSPTLTRPVAPILDEPSSQLWTTASGLLTRIRLDAASPNLAFNHAIEARITTQGRSAIAHGFKFQVIDVLDVNRRFFFQPEIESTFGTIDILKRMHYNVRTQDSHGQRSPADSAFTDARE